MSAAKAKWRKARKPANGGGAADAMHSILSDLRDVRSALRIGYL